MVDFKAKKHSVLETLKKELSRGFLEREYTVSGHKFKLHTLNEEEESWADGFTRSTTVMASITSRKAPRLAVAISAIDDIPVDKLFDYPDDMPKEVQVELNTNNIARKYWIRDQVLYFFAEDSNRAFIVDLFDKLAELEKERDEALKVLPS